MSVLHGYHAHIYYGDAPSAVAEKLCQNLVANIPGVEIGKNFGIAGPHPVAQCQLIFATDAFAEVVQWLMFNRQGLSVLVHPLSDDEYDDHTANALWLGPQVQLRVETLPHGPYPQHLLPGSARQAAAQAL